MAANCSLASDTLSCLRKADGKLLSIAGYLDTAPQINGDFYYAPVVDGTFIQDRPEALLAQGKINGKRLWVTHNFNEGLIVGNGSFVPQTIGNSTAAQRAYLSGFFPTIDNSTLTAIQNAYTAETFGSLQVATDLAYGEGIFGCQALWLSQAFTGNSYLTWLVIPGFNVHGSDIALSFGSTALAGTPYQAVAMEWIDNLNSFITSYSLSTSFAPSTFDTGSPRQVVVNTTASLAPNVAYDAVPADFVSRCNLWRSIAPVVPF